MNILGVNLKETKTNHPLNDGGACLIHEGNIVAIAEERLTRIKHDSGFNHSIDYCLNVADLSIEDIDLFVFSSCCEIPRNLKTLNIPNIPLDKTIVIDSHHLSHAYSAYMTSNFDSAIILTLDNEGNILNETNEDIFYKNESEKMSYYLGKDNEISLLERDTVPVGNIGVGDAYRYFTNYLGFGSYSQAGKTMGLAPYGRKSTFSDIKIFKLNYGHIECLIKEDYFNPVKVINEFFNNEYNIELEGPRTTFQDITQQHKDLAYLIQKETERIIYEKIDYLIQKTGIYDICISGGVGLNSVLNGKILQNTKAKQVHIVPAAGDSGQCLGNALYGYHYVKNQKKRLDINNAYLGKEYNDEEIKVVLDQYENKINIECYSSEDELLKKSAYLLNCNYILALFNGRSEFGPRSLGNRSIIMSPLISENKDILNKKVKFRESFRPFAPSVIEERSDEFFELYVKSPYMLMAVNVKKPDIIPAVTHIDNSARVQTVSKDKNPFFYGLISTFEQSSGVPVVLNTSFNIAGEPMVESPRDAIETFLKTNIDFLIFNKYIVSKIDKTKKTMFDVYGDIYKNEI